MSCSYHIKSFLGLFSLQFRDGGKFGNVRRAYYKKHPVAVKFFKGDERYAFTDEVTILCYPPPYNLPSRIHLLWKCLSILYSSSLLQLRNLEKLKHPHVVVMYGANPGPGVSLVG